MKKLLLTWLGCCLFIFVTPVFADKAPTNSLPMSTILQKLESQGYTVVKEIKWDDERFKTEAVNAQGHTEKFEVNPQTGEIINAPSSTTAKMTALEAAKKVEAAGYQRIFKLEVEKDKFEVKALNKEGKKVKLIVDSATGNITKK